MANSKHPRERVNVQKLNPLSAAISGSSNLSASSAAAANQGADAVKIVFPCDYSIRVVGDAADDYLDMVAAVVLVHAPDFDRSTMTLKDSSKGRFMSATLMIRATGEDQLKALFEDLKATGRVKMVI